MSLRRALQSSRTAIPQETVARQAVNEAKPWSRRAWTREQLRAHWPHLTIQQVELLKEVFQLFDTEDKGYFTKDDLFFVMEAMGGSPTPQELDAVMYELDSNGDSVVDFPEFLTKFLTATDEKELLSVFHQLAIQEGEGNDDRVLTLTAVERSFQYVGERLTDEDKKYLEVIFRGADKDNNGRLDIKEFTAYLEKMDDELFMGQAGALGSLLAAANISGNTKGLRSGRYGGGGGSRRRSNCEDNGGGDPGDAAVSLAAAGATGDPDVGAAMLSNGQLLAMATRALSGRGGAASLGFGGGSGLPDDMESITSNQGGLRNSFLSKLRRRHRRNSVNSSTIAAIAGQLASLGVTSSGRAMRAGSMNSAVCMAAAGLLQQEAPEGLRSASSVRTAAGAHAGPGPGLSPGSAPHFLVEGSGVSTLRLVSSTGQIGGYLSPEDQSPSAVLATAPVALSRGGSFGDSAAAAAAAAYGAVGTEGVLTGFPRQQYPHSGWAPGAGGSSGGGGGGVTETPGLRGTSFNHHRHHPHPHPHKHAHPQQPPKFHQVRSQSMSAAMTASAPALTPLAIPASLRDPDEPPSSSPSTFSPAGSSAMGSSGSPAPERQGGGGGVNAGFSSRPTGGLRSPAATWQKASVIQEAPEEGDSGYGGMTPVVPGQQQEQQQQQQQFYYQRFSDHRVEYPTRASAPTRFGRLASFPARMPNQPDMAAGSVGVGVGGSTSASGGDAAASPVSPCVDGRASGGLLPPRPIRLASGGDGRLGNRIGGLMAAVFSRQWSLGPGAAAAAAAAQAGSYSPTGRDSERGRRPSPSQAQLHLLQPTTGRPLPACSTEKRTEHGVETAAVGSTSSIWGFAAGARVAMGWLRRASSLGSNRAGAGSSSGTGGTVRGSQMPPPPPVSPPPEAVAAAAASGAVSPAPTRLLSVEVPGAGALPGNSKPTSPAVDPGETSSLAMPFLVASATPPFTLAVATAGTTGGGGGLASPPVAVVVGSAAAAGGPPGPAESCAPSLQPQAQSCNRPPPPSTPTSRARPPPSSPGQAAHMAVMQPYFRTLGSPQSRASAPGAPPWLHPPLSYPHPHPHPYPPQGFQHTSPGLQSAETAAWLPPRPPPLINLNAPLRVKGSARVLHRSGSTGGSSRLAVSSVRDSPPAMPPHMQRQQSLQPHHHHHQQQHEPHHSDNNNNSSNGPLPPPPHRLNQQGLPQHMPYTSYPPRGGPQSPHESYATPLPLQPLATPPPPLLLQQQLQQPPPQQQPQTRPGPRPGSPSESGCGTPSVPGGSTQGAYGPQGSPQGSSSGHKHCAQQHQKEHQGRQQEQQHPGPPHLQQETQQQQAPQTQQTDGLQQQQLQKEQGQQPQEL